MVLDKLDSDYSTRYPELTEWSDKLQNSELLMASNRKKQVQQKDGKELDQKSQVFKEISKKIAGSNNVQEDKCCIKKKNKVGVSLEEYEQLGVISDQPKNQEFKDPFKRLESYKEWPPDHHLKPKILSASGFYYTDHGDCTRCFWCGGGLRNWKDTDDVWVEHARWFPKCAYIKQKMGQAFIEAVQHYNRTHENIPIEMVLKKVGRENVTLYKDDLKYLRKENDVLSDQTECKICLDKNVEIVFLPCGHLVSCTECAAALNICPLCRQQIHGRVRAILS